MGKNGNPIVRGVLGYHAMVERRTGLLRANVVGATQANSYQCAHWFEWVLLRIRRTNLHQCAHWFKWISSDSPSVLSPAGGTGVCRHGRGRGFVHPAVHLNQGRKFFIPFRETEIKIFREWPSVRRPALTELAVWVVVVDTSSRASSVTHPFLSVGIRTLKI